MPGKFIVLYGINNLGKSTQAKLLVEKLNSSGRKAKYLKYPIYELEPTGPALNRYLRGGNPEKLSAKNAQIVYAKNREDYEPTLKKELESGTDIVAEDYWGTGVAWGVGAGVDKEFLLDLNKRFNFEDLPMMLTGKRFESGVEKNHLHESDIEFTNKVEKVHRELAREFRWKKISANQDIDKVAAGIWSEVKKII
ncbi:MAG: hypothetical protein A2846_03140 [Candidatus Doudnabacteria bacterium RIFCSPHIGHO2_01_FULL_49_9]|uniref:Thymidylate kinase-like domain-containing protein n=1 Tax=Candidatus Doudnabacteria bacterium RIFCSPHIGHO2_01_FULL_49_9 TaxID=1817827 RepID=A0A1F5P2G5_9BACT|nr:MAG: hypothetical protein A2846_03140 [Candidatus Doudnabacteria bacterium RIFCSPHIGHO2_01_FULL_49_9]